MQSFLKNKRVEPAKKNVLERLKNFNEIMRDMTPHLRKHSQIDAYSAVFRIATTAAR